MSKESCSRAVHLIPASDFAWHAVHHVCLHADVRWLACWLVTLASLDVILQPLNIISVQVQVLSNASLRLLGEKFAGHDLLMLLDLLNHGVDLLGREEALLRIGANEGRKASLHKHSRGMEGLIWTCSCSAVVVARGAGQVGAICADVT